MQRQLNIPSSLFFCSMCFLFWSVIVFLFVCFVFLSKCHIAAKKFYFRFNSPGNMFSGFRFVQVDLLRSVRFPCVFLSAVIFSFSKPFLFQCLLHGYCKRLLLSLFGLDVLRGHFFQYITPPVIDILNWILSHYLILEDSSQFQEPHHLFNSLKQCKEG